MQMKFWRFDLKLAHPWAIPSDGTVGGKNSVGVVIVQLAGAHGVIGLGEASPSNRYNEDVDGSLDFLSRVDVRKLSFDDVERSMAYIEAIAPGQFSAKSALHIALLDGAARLADKPLYDFLVLGFREGHHITSFSIGLDEPRVIREKVLAAAAYPVLKLKVGARNDRENLKALRDAAPKKWVRVDANEGWKTREQALEMIEWLAKDGFIQFVEQPMPAETQIADLTWLKERSPLPLIADESYHTASDVAHCGGRFSWGECEAVQDRRHWAARRSAAGRAPERPLKTMLGCMIETSLLISAAAHLAELTDHLDIDGALLTTNDPYEGVTAERGVVSFANTAEKTGLRVRAR